MKVPKASPASVLSWVGLTDLRVAVDDSQGERLHFCVVAGLDDRFGGKVLHGDGEFAHVYGDRREAVGLGFLDVAAGRCERHKGEERVFFKHKIKRFRDIWFLGINVYLCRKEANPESAESAGLLASVSFFFRL